jgi:hypothetical protein
MRVCLAVKENLHVPPQVREALHGDVRPELRLSGDEIPLKHRLRVQSQALGAPGRIRSVPFRRRLDVLGDFGRVLADVTVTSGPDLRVRVVDLMHHRAQKTGELRKFTLENGDPGGDTETQLVITTDVKEIPEHN